MRPALHLLRRADETGTPPWLLASRVARGAARRRVPGLRTVAVPIDDLGTRIVADLTLPFGRSLYRYGFPEPEARLLHELLRPGDVFVDGGAHIGVFSLLAAARVGESGRVISCEPVPDNYRLLQNNVALNGFTWVECHMAALGDKAGQEALFTFGAGSALASFAPASLEGSIRVPVEVKTLDEVASGREAQVRLVKLDIEGAEARALRGAPVLLRARPDFLLELEPEHLARQGSSVGDLEKLFTDAGYRAFEIHGDARRVDLVPMDSWRRPAGIPNVFVSARPRPLA